MNPRYTYLIFDGKFYKIGQSLHPDKRLSELKTANPKCRLICFGYGRTEKQLHDIFAKNRISREWFDLRRSDVEMCIRLIDGKESSSDLNTCANKRAKSLLNKDAKDYRLTFGKYKGQKLGEIKDGNYLKWMLTIPNLKRDNPKLYRCLKLI